MPTNHNGLSVPKSHGHRLENSSGIFYALTVLDGCHISTTLLFGGTLWFVWRRDMAAVFLFCL